MVAFELVPVVEIAPWRLTDRPLPESTSPPGSESDDAAFTAYVEACARDAGFDDLEAVAPDSFHVPILALNPGHVSRLVEQWLTDSQYDIGALHPAPDENDGSLSAHYGGLAVFWEQQLISEPACCSDLDVWREWADALDAELPQEIWNGHDGTRIELRRTASGAVRIRFGPWGTERWVDSIVVPLGALESQLEDVVATLERFAEHVIDCLPSGVQFASRAGVARAIVGLSG